MASDLRVPMAPIISAFGLAITVTRPSPDDTPVTTTGVWLPTPLEEQRAYGTDFQRFAPRRVMGVPRSADLSTAPKGTVILAPLQAGDTVKAWRVDGYDGHMDADLMRLILVETLDT